MCVYLLHFERPLAHARHYVGFSQQLDARLWHHRNGTGARLMQAVGQAGIKWKLARVWDGQGRTFERKLKNTHSVADYCPKCAGKRVRTYAPK